MSSPESGEKSSSAGSSASLSERSRRKRRNGREGAVPPGDEAAPSEQSNTEPSGSQDGSPGEKLFGRSFRDLLVPYILLAISMQRAHGYFIEQYLRGIGLANVEMSTLYRTLRQLERDGLVFSAWEPGPEGPARRIYSLTEAGRWWLDAGAAALAGYREIIDRFFGSYSGLAGKPDDDKDQKGFRR